MQLTADCSPLAMYNWTDVRSNSVKFTYDSSRAGKACHVIIRADDKAPRDWAVYVRVAVKVVSACYLNVLAVKTPWPEYGRTERCAVSKMWVGTMLLTSEFLQTAFLFHQWNFLSLSLCSSSLRLTHSVCAVDQNEHFILLDGKIQGDGRKFLDLVSLLSNSKTSQAFETSGIDAFRWQCSGHFNSYITRLS